MWAEIKVKCVQEGRYKTRLVRVTEKVDDECPEVIFGRLFAEAIDCISIDVDIDHKKLFCQLAESSVVGTCAERIDTLNAAIERIRGAASE